LRQHPNPESSPVRMS